MQGVVEARKKRRGNGSRANKEKTRRGRKGKKNEERERKRKEVGGKESNKGVIGEENKRAGKGDIN